MEEQRSRGGVGGNVRQSGLLGRHRKILRFSLCYVWSQGRDLRRAWGGDGGGEARFLGSISRLLCAERQVPDLHSSTEGGRLGRGDRWTLSGCWTSSERPHWG